MSNKTQYICFFSFLKIFAEKIRFGAGDDVFVVFLSGAQNTQTRLWVITSSSFVNRVNVSLTFGFSTRFKRPIVSKY